MLSAIFSTRQEKNYCVQNTVEQRIIEGRYVLACSKWSSTISAVLTLFILLSILSALDMYF